VQHTGVEDIKLLVVMLLTGVRVLIVQVYVRVGLIA